MDSAQRNDGQDWRGPAGAAHRDTKNGRLSNLKGAVEKQGTTFLGYVSG
jgi:hypothetical protein